MTTTVSLSSPITAPALGTALRELGIAAFQVLVALRAALFSAGNKPPLSAHDEAERVRALAFSHLKTDRRFANDLFAAADRHELLNGG